MAVRGFLLHPQPISCRALLWPPAPASAAFAEQSCRSQAETAAKICGAAGSHLHDLPWGRAHPAGPSGDVCPQRLFQAPLSRTGLDKKQPRKKTMISMSTCGGCRDGGEGFPSLDIFHQKTESLYLALKSSTPSTSSAFPGQVVPPGIPQNQQTSANLLQTRAAQQCQTPGISERCLCLPCSSLWPSPRASLLFLRRVLFHCCLPSSQGSKF